MGLYGKRIYKAVITFSDLNFDLDADKQLVNIY
jgi:hypothetical protein